jgi:hypothetical protein
MSSIKERMEAWVINKEEYGSIRVPSKMCVDATKPKLWNLEHKLRVPSNVEHKLVNFDYKYSPQATIMKLLPNVKTTLTKPFKI